MKSIDELIEEKNDPKIWALIQFLDFEESDYDRFTKSEYNDNIYIIDKDEDIKSSYKNNEFLVCTDEEADKEHHDSFMNLVDDLGLSAFSKSAQEYILENFIDEDKSDWFDNAYEECTRSYAEDIINEEQAGEEFTVTGPENEDVNVTITNRLLLECIENHIIEPSDLEVGENITEEGEWIGGDLIEKYCDYFDDASKQGYEDNIDWFRFDFGDEELRKVIAENNLIDWDAVCEWTKKEDGRGNELGRWDGNEYEEEVNGETYYIYPDCDFKELESRDAKREQIERD